MGYHKIGSIDGFNSSTYLMLEDRAFVIVPGNSSGSRNPPNAAFYCRKISFFQCSPVRLANLSTLKTQCQSKCKCPEVQLYVHIFSSPHQQLPDRSKNSMSAIRTQHLPSLSLLAR